MPDGGFAVLGGTWSQADGHKLSTNYHAGWPNLKTSDYWLLRLNDEAEYLGALLQTHDGGFLVGGYSRSGVRGNKTVPNLSTASGEDFWVLKLGLDALTAPPSLRWEPCCHDDTTGYRLLLRGSSNLTYRVEFSTDLMSWTRLREVQATGTEVEVFASSLGVQPWRFFRAVLVPPQ